MKFSWIKLAFIAFICVLKTMREGYKRYPDERWKKQDLAYHALHAANHAGTYFSRNYEEDDIAHMITRGAMIKYLEDKYG